MIIELQDERFNMARLNVGLNRQEVPTSAVLCGDEAVIRSATNTSSPLELLIL